MKCLKLDNEKKIKKNYNNFKSKRKFKEPTIKKAQQIEIKI